MNKNELALVSHFGDQKRWVNWKYKNDDKGKPTKVPYQKDLTHKASTSNHLTWSSYEEVLKASPDIGIIFTSDQLLLGIDIDKCLENGEIVHDDGAQIERFLAEMNTYVEISPSGTGLHAFLILRDPLELTRNKKAPYELYTSGRFFTVTKNVYRDFKELRTVTSKEASDLLSVTGYPWTKKQAMKDTNHFNGALDDGLVLSKMFASKNGAKIESLYRGDTSAYSNDDSSADLALCNYLAYWTAGNASQIERLWLNSPLGSREKTRNRQDYRTVTIRTAIDSCNGLYSPDRTNNLSKEFESQDSSPNGKRSSQLDSLLKMIDDRKDIRLFHDERENPFVSLDVDGHDEIWSCRSRDMKNWLSHEFWKKYSKGLGSEAITGALNVIEGKARFEGKKHALNIRMALEGQDIWYDLANSKWEAIKMSKDGWNVVSKPPILFKRYSHQDAQVYPSSDRGDASLILNYVNVENRKHRILILVLLISYFIPNFPHPLFLIHGSQGSAKTTFAKLLRMILDPSQLGVLSLPYGYKDLVQTLDHHAFLFFDNVSAISAETSDILCKAVTGGGFSKRELYSNDDDVIYSFKRCIGINGINIVATRPDLLERSILIELNRIDPKNRKEEGGLMKGFENDLPQILAGIFDVLVKAIGIKPTIKLSSAPRMADFATWGCAIAKALGYSQEEFLSAYEENINQQSEVVINDNVVARTLVEFMENKIEWSGTATELLHQIEAYGLLQGVDTYEQYWPKSSNAFTRKLNELKVNLREIGIEYSTSKGVNREVTLKKVQPVSTQPSLMVEDAEKDDMTL